jgi:beta-xylosidase
VQLYLHDPVAGVVRPLQRLIGYTRVAVSAGSETRVTAKVPADLSSYTGRNGDRIVEPGELVLGFGRSSADIPLTLTVTVVGETRIVDHHRELFTVWS